MASRSVVRDSDRGRPGSGVIHPALPQEFASQPCLTPRARSAPFVRTTATTFELQDFISGADAKLPNLLGTPPTAPRRARSAPTTGCKAGTRGALASKGRRRDARRAVGAPVEPHPRRSNQFGEADHQAAPAKIEWAVVGAADFASVLRLQMTGNSSRSRPIVLRHGCRHES
jgi:hypothetical protein